MNKKIAKITEPQSRFFRLIANPASSEGKRAAEKKWRQLVVLRFSAIHTKKRKQHHLGGLFVVDRTCVHETTPTEGRRSELFHTHAHACSSSVKWRCLYSSCARSSLPSRLMNKCDITLPSLVYFLFFFAYPICFMPVCGTYYLSHFFFLFHPP